MATSKKTPNNEQIDFQGRLEKAEESLQILQKAGVDSIVVNAPGGRRYYTLVGSDQPYGILIDTVNEAAACLANDGSILYCNERFGNLLKSAPDKLVGDLFVHQLHESQREQIAKLLEQDKEGRVDVQLAATSDNTPVRIYLYFSRIFINKLERTYVLLMDATENDQIVQKLEMANKRLKETLHARDTFLAAVSHNLRTPLNSIIGFADILLSKMPGPLNEEQENQLKIITRCSHQLLVLIRQLLDVGLIQHDKLAPVFSRCDINSILSNVVEEVKPLAAEKGLELTASFVSPEFYISTDRKFFRQVVVNLLDNAIKYTKTGSVRLLEQIVKTPETQFLEIEIIDTGCGVKEEDLSQIFELYSTVSKRDDPYGEHTGLGLVLCRKYCDALGMALTCKSIYGKGTSFIIQIPIENNL